MNKKAKILIADDESVSRHVIKNYLTSDNFIVSTAINGQQALDIFHNDPPDMVLLDIEMPELDGFEVCRILREKYPKNQLPIIFLTSRTQMRDLVSGLSMGANDYLVKPFPKEELLARIQSHLQVSHLNAELLLAKQQLEAINQDLEHQVKNRTQALKKSLNRLEKQHNTLKMVQSHLIQSEKMAGLGTLVAGIAHEINNPTNFSYSGAQNMHRKLAQFQTFLVALAGDDAGKKVLLAIEQKFTGLFHELEAILEGTDRIRKIVLNLRTFSRLDESEFKLATITEGIQSTIDLIRPTYKHQIIFHIDFQANPEIECNPAQLNQVFMNVIMNACQAMLQKQQKHPKYMGHLKIKTSQLERRLIIRITDDADGITKAVQAKIFEPFFTTKPVGEGTGLGLSISFGVIKEHRGEIICNSSVEKGTEMVIFLPV